MEIIKGKINKPVKVTVYGPEGIGKSTFASKFPDPLFIDTEGSTSHMDVARLPEPTSWQMILQEVQYVIDNPTCCKTLIIDTADWAEKLCAEHVCSSNKVTSIESFGYGKGYTYLKEEFGKFLNRLNDVLGKGINVVITAHAMMRKFEQPDEMGAYDRWELKLSKQCSPLVKEWADMVLFCNYKTMVVNVDNQGAVKGKNKAQGGKRVMYTSHHPCWDAKNRFNLPDELDMDYNSIKRIIESQSVEEEKTAPIPESQPEINVVQQVEENISVISQPESKQLSISDIGKEIEPPEPPKKEPEQEQEKTKELTSDFGFLSDIKNIPKSLYDLMTEDHISEWQIQDAVYEKGYYPKNTLIQDMDPAFIDGWIIAFWPKVKELALEISNREQIPFN